jgi:signal transduction histidine kinase
MNPYAVLALIAALSAAAGGIYIKGRVDGAAVVQARLVAAQEAAREATAKLEASRLIAQAERDRLARELEDMANEEPVSVPDALPASRVRRLREIQ